jgi:hypothetical protein
VIFVLLDFVLEIVLVPTVGYFWGLEAAAAVGLFVATLAVGYVFAGQIREDRMGSIGRILVLSAAVLIFASMMGFAANGSYSAYVQDTLRSMFSDTGSWSPGQWYAYEQIALVENLAFSTVLVLVLGFVGLYVGSMRRVSAKK